LVTGEVRVRRDLPNNRGPPSKNPPSDPENHSHRKEPISVSDASDAVELLEEFQVRAETPEEWRRNPHSDEVLGAPKIPMNPERIPIPAAISGRAEPTPTLPP